MGLERFFHHISANTIKKSAIPPTTPPRMTPTGGPLPEELFLVEAKGGVGAGIIVVGVGVGVGVV